jgi:hypothetical protein
MFHKAYILLFDPNLPDLQRSEGNRKILLLRNEVYGPLQIVLTRTYVLDKCGGETLWRKSLVTKSRMLLSKSGEIPLHVSEMGSNHLKPALAR